MYAGGSPPLQPTIAAQLLLDGAKIEPCTIIIMVQCWGRSISRSSVYIVCSVCYQVIVCYLLVHLFDTNLVVCSCVSCTVFAVVVVVCVPCYLFVYVCLFVRVTFLLFLISYFVFCCCSWCVFCEFVKLFQTCLLQCSAYLFVFLLYNLLKDSFSKVNKQANMHCTYKDLFLCPVDFQARKASESGLFVQNLISKFHGYFTEEHFR
jgi:hypothetical protein